MSKARQRIMYVECKADGLCGPARIARVTFSKTGRTLYYAGRAFQNLNGRGYKTTHFDVESGDYYWISGARRDGFDPLYPTVVSIDEDVRAEYWKEIRRQPERANEASFRSNGKYPRRASGNGRRLA